MKLEPDLIRDILLALEARGPGEQGILEHISGNEADADRINYHLWLLLDADLIAGKDNGSYGEAVPSVYVSRLTMQGHEHLDSIRDAGIWERTKTIAREKVGIMALDVLVAISTQLVKEKVKEALGFGPV